MRCRSFQSCIYPQVPIRDLYSPVLGVMHNISLLRDILDRPAFLAGNLSTNFLNEEYQDGFKGKLM